MLIKISNYKLLFIILVLKPASVPIKRKNEEQENRSILSDMLSEETGLFLLEGKSNETPNGSLETDKNDTPSLTIPPSYNSMDLFLIEEAKIFESLEGNSAQSKVIINELTDFCQKSQLKKQAQDIYNITLEMISKFQAAKQKFYKIRLDHISNVSNVFNRLFRHDRTHRKDFSIIDRQLLLVMKEYESKMLSYVVKSRDGDIINFSNFIESEDAVCSVMFEIKALTDQYAKCINIRGEYIEDLSVELRKIKKWYDQIPELMLLHSNIHSSEEHIFFIILYRALNVFFDDKKVLKGLDVQIILRFILKIESSDIRNLRNDIIFKDKPIYFYIKNNKFNRCHKAHPQMVHYFLGNVFPNIRNNMRNRFKRTKFFYYLTYEHLRNILISMTIKLYEQLLIFEFYFYKDYNYEEYERLLDDLKREIECYGCLFSRFYNLFISGKYESE